MSTRPTARSLYAPTVRSPYARVGASAAAAPAALPDSGNILARWSADDITPQADNTALTTWTDSVSAIAATQGTGVFRPLYRTNRIGTKPSVQFSGSQFLSAANATLNASIDSHIGSVFVVFKSQGASTYGVLFLGGSYFMYADNTNVGNFNAPANLGKTIPYAGQTAFSTIGATVTKPDATGGGTGQQRYFINGGGVTMNSLAMSSAGTTSVQMGCDPGVNFGFVGEIFEVVYWSTKLNPAQLLQCEKWACDKYSQAYPWAASSYFPVFDGDSLTAGSGATGPAGSYPYQAAASLGLSYGQWTNVGTGSITMADMDALGPTVIDTIGAIVGKPIKLAAFEWYNQRAAAPTPADSSRTYIAARRAAGAKVCFGTSTDTSAATDANRAAYNADFDASHALMEAYVAIHTNSGIGLESAYANFPANFSDPVHLTDAGYTILAGLMVTGLNSIP